MTALQRTAVGPFPIAGAVKFDEIDPVTIRKNLVPPARIFASLASFQFEPHQIAELANGALYSAEFLQQPREQERLVALDEKGKLLAVLTRIDGGMYKPELNFAQYYLDDSRPEPIHQSSDSS